MKKYFLVIRNTWEEILTYRLNFTMWRVRTVLQLISLYFLWKAILPPGQQLGSYDQQTMLTYILGSQIVFSIVFSTRTHEIGENINNGDLSIFLVRPIKYFGYWIARDVGDKLMNILFSIVEIGILVFLLAPPLFIQTDPTMLFLTVCTVLLATILYFLISANLGLVGFWSPDVWAPRFVFFVAVSFFAGGLFPLDILPKPVFELFSLTPFPYVMYFPLKIYLGQLSMWEIYKGVGISLLWTILLVFILRFIFSKGLRLYTAVGR